MFAADETGIDTAPGDSDGTVRGRLVAKRSETGHPVRGTTELQLPPNRAGAEENENNEKNAPKAKGKQGQAKNDD